MVRESNRLGSYHTYFGGSESPDPGLAAAAIEAGRG
jgi:hypothetical protein